MDKKEDKIYLYGASDLVIAAINSRYRTANSSHIKSDSSHKPVSGIGNTKVSDRNKK